MTGRAPRSGARTRQGAAVWLAACLVVALLASLVVALRSAADDTLLSVNGWKLTRAEFAAQLEQISHDPAYLAARSRNGQSFAVFRSGSTTDFDPAFVVEFLNERVTFRLAAAEVAHRGLLVTSDDRVRALATIEAGLAADVADPRGTSPATTPAPVAPSVVDGLGPYRDVLIDGVVNLQVLQRALGAGNGVKPDDAVRLLYDQVKDRYANQACGRHLLVRAGGGRTDDKGKPVAPTEDEYAAARRRVDELRTQIAGGTDLGTLAATASDDFSTRASGGDLGCAPKGRYSGAFDEALWSQPIGAVGDPVRSDFGWHLVQVTERRLRTFEEVQPALQRAIDAQGQQALQEWLAAATRAAEVVVDRGVGRWNATTGVIEPPGQTPLSLEPDTGGPVSGTTPGTVAGVPRAAADDPLSGAGGGGVTPTVKGTGER